MNSFAHFFINYVILSLFIPNISDYFWVVLVFSTIVDLDHIPGLFTYFSHKKKIKKPTSEECCDMVRTAIQEPVGIVILLLMFYFLYLFGVDGTLMFIAGASLFLHWLVDVLTVYSKPFVPFSNKVVYVFFKTRKEMVYRDIIITSASFIAFLVVYL